MAAQVVFKNQRFQVPSKYVSGSLSTICRMACKNFNLNPSDYTLSTMNGQSLNMSQTMREARIRKGEKIKLIEKKFTQNNDNIHINDTSDINKNNSNSNNNDKNNDANNDNDNNENNDNNDNKTEDIDMTSNTNIQNNDDTNVVSPDVSMQWNDSSHFQQNNADNNNTNNSNNTDNNNTPNKNTNNKNYNSINDYDISLRQYKIGVQMMDGTKKRYITHVSSNMTLWQSLQQIETQNDVNITSKFKTNDKNEQIYSLPTLIFLNKHYNTKEKLETTHYYQIPKMSDNTLIRLKYENVTMSNNNNKKENTELSSINTNNNENNDNKKEEIIFAGREAKLFIVPNIKFNSRAHDETEDFYEIDENDFNLILKSIRKYDPSSSVKDEASKKLSTYPFTVIRIRLPSNLQYENYIQNIPYFNNNDDNKNNNDDNKNNNSDNNNASNTNVKTNVDTNMNTNVDTNMNTNVNANETENKNEDKEKEKNKIEHIYLQGNFLINETIKNIRAFINENIQNIQNDDYILFIALPHTILDDDNQTLLSLQLVPRAIINLKLSKQSNLQDIVINKNIQKQYYFPRS